MVLDEARQTKDQLTITVKVNYLPEVVEFLYYQQGGWLSVLFGNDERKLNGHYAVYYVLSMEQGTKCWITVRVEVDANKPEYPSVTPRVPAAVWASAKCVICTARCRSACRTNAGWCCRTTGRTNSIRCAKTAWIIASVRRRPPTPKPTSLLTSSAARKQRGADWPAARHL